MQVSIKIIKSPGRYITIIVGSDNIRVTVKKLIDIEKVCTNGFREDRISRNITFQQYETFVRQDVLAR